MLKSSRKAVLFKTSKPGPSQLSVEQASLGLTHVAFNGCLSLEGFSSGNSLGIFYIWLENQVETLLLASYDHRQPAIMILYLLEWCIYNTITSITLEVVISCLQPLTLVQLKQSCLQSHLPLKAVTFFPLVMYHFTVNCSF